ncbi:hypothetical protein F4780DRAFT_780711 [Xylariomycetidae sp. FL0641]|nr:hypothetical protein F4780DRAFT_780711 [Xylariomycetidae sp. FL0641]
MCRKVIIHHMHHDVATPMVLDPISSNPTQYENPTHTNHHRCELALPLPGGWLLNSPRGCAWHSCCLPEEQVEWCADALWWVAELRDDERRRRQRPRQLLRPPPPCAATTSWLSDASDDDEEDEYDLEDEEWDDEITEIEPEQCSLFALEHRHVELAYLGARERFAAAAPAVVVPATWRRLQPVRWTRGEGRGVACPDYLGGRWAHDAGYRARFETLLFGECGALHTLEHDARIAWAVSQDLARAASPYAAEGAARFRAARAARDRQRILVIDMLKWAMEPCGCVRDPTTPHSGLDF